VETLATGLVSVARPMDFRYSRSIRRRLGSCLVIFGLSCYQIVVVVALGSLKSMMSPTTPDAALAYLQATALTARCHNALFRLKQLKSLHDTLRNNCNQIKDAIKQDTHVSDEEATAEVALALDVVREHYGSIDTKKELEAEYRVTNGRNASDRRQPWGVAYIEPQRIHTPFLSVITPLSAALAAGNCVALKVRIIEPQ
jgi:aldehyde dehydrogenase (NAD+)